MSGFPIYLFDYDGTLAATRAAALACLTRTLAERGETAAEARIDAAIGSGVPLEAAIASLSPAMAPAAVGECVTRYRELYPDIDRDLTCLFDGARETIAALHEDGRAIVVLSNKGRAAVETALARFDLIDRMTAIVAADPGAPVKPDPEVFHRRVRPLFAGAPLSDFLMVGDTAADLAFAGAAGIRSCWARYGYGDAGRCLSMNPDFVIDALPDLLSPSIGPG